MSRRKARESALTALYQLDISTDEKDRVLTDSGASLPDQERKFYMQLSLGVQEHLDKIDVILGRYLKETWTMDRLSIIDRTILRLAVYELIYSEEPEGAVLSEAVEIAKVYSSFESSRFINGVLASIVKQEVKGKDVE